MSYYNASRDKDYSAESAAIERHLEQLSDYPEWREGVRLCRLVVPLCSGHRDGTPAAAWADQLYRAAASIPANIAEGVGRMQRGQLIQFLRYSRGSAFECVTHLMTAPVSDLDTRQVRLGYAGLIEMIDASIDRLIEQS